MEQKSHLVPWISLAISALALLVSSLSFWVSYRLNKRQIAKLDRESEHNCKAEVTIALRSSGNDSHRSARSLVVANHGRATARNVSADIPPGQGLILGNHRDLFPIASIPAGSEISIPAQVHALQEPMLEIEIRWSDDESETQVRAQKLFLQ